MPERKPKPFILGAYQLGEDDAPIRRTVDLGRPGDYGADPMGDGRFRMVPSGDVVDLAERNRRLAQ